MFWTIIYIVMPMFIVAAIGEGVMAYIDWHRKKYGRFINVNFRKDWM